MRKIASHYWLRPDGSIGKFPIISFDNDGRITEIRERDVFKEEAFLELVNGLLIPGLVDFYSLSTSICDLSSIKRYVNKQLINGVKALGVSRDKYPLVKDMTSVDITLCEIENIDILEDKLVGFEKIRAAKDPFSELIKLTLENACRMDNKDKYGSLEIGKSPGLLAISNLNYEPFLIHSQTKLKIII